MKKLFSIFSILFLAVLLVACNKDSESSLVISKIFSPSTQANNLIELYNNSDKDIKFKNHSIRFYTNGSKEVTNEIKLVGTIKANDYFVLGSSNFGVTQYKDLIDQVYEEGSLPFNGNDAIELASGKKTLDFVGTTGIDINFSKNLTLIRIGNKEDYKADGTYNKFNFIQYLPGLYQYLKNDNHEIKTLEDIYAGPRLEDRYKEMTYVDAENSSLGGGGAVLTKNSGISDGDTASFQAMNGFPGGSVRYFYINTPEVDGSYVQAEPWGYVASKYNKEYLLNNPNSKEIYIQSIPGYNLKETNGRNLGLVWINGHLSQFLIVAEGLVASVDQGYQSYDLLLTYKNVPYLTFLLFAEERAAQNGWGTKGYPANPNGEKSPDWNYQSNKLATTSPIWTPHLPIPWEIN